MAGDWIKVELALPDKPEVWVIAKRLNIDVDAVLGKLIRVWIWFDQQSEDGRAPGVVAKLLDSKVGVEGFIDLLIDIGWMDMKNEQLMLVNFERHNGKTAKNRALTNTRVKRCRNAGSVTSALPEKRKEEKNSYSDDFTRFWAEYPRKENKVQAAQAFEKLSPDPELVDQIIGNIQTRSTNGDWSKKERQHIPHGSTYLNNRRWEDEPEEASVLDLFEVIR